MTNVLILSCGTRNKVVQYFKKALLDIGHVVCTDMSAVAPALYEGYKYYIVPRITEPGYIDIILDICRKENIKGVLSLIDPELGLLADNERKFTELGVTIIGSSRDLCDMCLNKMKMFEWLVQHGYRTAKSYINKEQFFKDINAGVLAYPVYVKPVCGSASIAINKAFDKETVDLLFAHDDNLMIQEYLNGTEIGADVYVDMISGEVVSIFTKRKLLMRAGETDKSVSFKDELLNRLIERFVKEAGFRGQIDIDIFEVDGEYYISEVNPRFGGGYPHAYECGCDHMKLIVNNLQGKANDVCIGDYEENIYMMKYCEVLVRPISNQNN